MQNDENQNEVVTALLEDIIMEVISSNRKKPSVPGVILETIIDIVNGVVDIESTMSSEPSPAVSSEVLESVALLIVADIVDEVIQSNNRQPSVPGIVLQLIMELITNSDSNNNQQTSSSKKPPATTSLAPQDVRQQKQAAGDEKVKKLEPSEAEKQKNAVTTELMPKVCNFWAETFIHSQFGLIEPSTLPTRALPRDFTWRIVYSRLSELYDYFLEVWLVAKGLIKKQF